MGHLDMMRIEAKRNATASQGLLPCFQHLLHALSLQTVVLFAVVLVSTTASRAQVGPEGGGASFFVGSNQRGEGGAGAARDLEFPRQRLEVGGDLVEGLIEFGGGRRCVGHLGLAEVAEWIGSEKEHWESSQMTRIVQPSQRVWR